MSTDTNEAQAYLENIKTVQQQTRRVLAQGGGPVYLMIWAAVWLIGFSGNQFAPAPVAGIMWIIADSAGIIATLFTAWRMTRQVRRPVLDARVRWFALAWVVYSVLLGVAAVPDGDVTRLGVVTALFAMFGYVIMGIWLWRPLAWIGITVTVIIVLGFVLIPGYVNGIIAFFGSGALFFAGMDLYRSGR